MFYTQIPGAAFFFFARPRSDVHLLFSKAILSLLGIAFLRLAVKKLYLLK